MLSHSINSEPEAIALAAHSAAHVFQYSEIGPSHPAGEAVLAAETALAISYNGINHSVMMVTPHALEDFLVGFSLGNAIIDKVDDMFDLQLSQTAEAWYAEVRISSRAFWTLKQQRRQQTTSHANLHRRTFLKKTSDGGRGASRVR